VIEEAPRGFLEAATALGLVARERVRRAIETGAPIVALGRRDGAFHLALLDFRSGKTYPEVLEHALAVNREQNSPAVAERLIRQQVDGALKYARRHPTIEEELRDKARRALHGEEPTAARTAAKRERALLRPPLRAVVPRPVEFLIDKVVPKGTLTLLAGVGGLGKSALALAYSKRVTDSRGNVLIVSYEDAAEQVLRPRFEALGGDLDLVHELYVDVLAGTSGFPTDLPELDRHVLETNAALVLIDPVSASIDLKLDAHKDQDVRVVLGQLAKLAERERLAILQNAHLNKAPSADPYLRINGSTAFYNASRSVLTVTRDPGEPDLHRLVAHHKSNYGPLGRRRAVEGRASRRRHRLWPDGGDDDAVRRGGRGRLSRRRAGAGTGGQADGGGGADRRHARRGTAAVGGREGGRDTTGVVRTDDQAGRRRPRRRSRGGGNRYRPCHVLVIAQRARANLYPRHLARPLQPAWASRS